MLTNTLYSVGSTLFKCITNSLFEQGPSINIPIFQSSSTPTPMQEHVLQIQNPETQTTNLFQKTLSPAGANERTSPVSITALSLTESLSDENPYKEVTRRIPDEELADIERKMKTISEKDHETFLQLVEMGNLAAIIGDEKHSGITDYPLHALSALQKGLLSVDDFATIIMPWASKDREKKCIPIFIDGEINEKARNAIESTLRLDRSSLLSADELEAFFEELKNLPKLQQHFWLETARDDQISLPSVRNEIFRQFRGLNVFSKSGSDFMIPSTGMMQTFLNIKFKENAVRMNFVLGLSSTDDIEKNGSTNTRDAALRFPGITLVNIADNYAALETDFTYHDFFHAIQTSTLSPTTRHLITKTARFVNSIKGNDPVLDHVYHALIDMENHEILRVISKRNIDTSILDKYTFLTLSNLMDLKPSFYATTLIVNNIACQIWEQPRLFAEEPLSFMNFLVLSAITLVRSLSPFSPITKIGTIENLKNQIALCIRDLEKQKKSTASSEMLTFIEEEIKKLIAEHESLENGTHPLQG